MKLTCFLLFASFFVLVLSNDEEELSTESATSSVVVEKIKYIRPVAEGSYHFQESFDEVKIGVKWLKSKAKKEDVDDSIAKYDGEWSIEPSIDSLLDGDKGLVLKSKAKHHAISTKLFRPFKFTDKKPLIVQYEVKFQNPLECGGAYAKLLADEPDLNLDNFYDKTTFSIMFGPDKCGGENKYHFIIKYKHPIKGTYEEKHAKKPDTLPDAFYTDGKTHLYTLIVKPDNTFKMLIDLNEVNSGSLLSDLTPPIVPPKEIVDPEDKKPEEWDDREKIPDPTAVKPDDWDESEPKLIPDANAKMPDGWLEEESETIPDSSAIQPEDWDPSTDGDWEAPKIENPACKDAPGCGPWKAPMVDNPKYKGKWRAPQIENPNFQGIWEPRKISNPDYFEETDPFTSLTPFSAIGLELWSMTDNIYFDNFIVTDDESVSNKFAEDGWKVKKDLELANSRSSDSVIDALVKATSDKPWLWALYILVVLVPIVLIVVFCCGKSSPAKKDTVALTKKNDAETKDDNAGDNENQNSGTSAADEEAEEEGEEEEEEKVETVSKSDLEEVDKDENEGEAKKEFKTSPRNRRPKKI